MNHQPTCCLALTALLCGIGPVVAGEMTDRLDAPRPGHGLESGSLLSGLVPFREPGANSALQLVSRTEVDLARSFAGDSLSWGRNRFAVPLQQETWRLDSRRSLLINALAIEWQHTMNASHVLTLSARHGDSLYSDADMPGSSGSAATLSWSALFGGDTRLIGRVFAGDEDAKERINGSTDRRYYGMHVEGRYGLWRDHAPFASLKWQRSNIEMPGNAGTSEALLRRESYSLLGAGWNWQVSPSWDMRAEANYRLADDGVDAVEFDRTRLYFSTRYGFR